MNHPGASARLSCIVLTALDLGFTGIQIDRAPGLFGEHVLRVGLPNHPGVTGVVLIDAFALAEDTHYALTDAIREAMRVELLPTMRLVAMVEAQWRQMEKVAETSWRQMAKVIADQSLSYCNFGMDVGPLLAPVPAPKALPSLVEKLNWDVDFTQKPISQGTYSNTNFLPPETFDRLIREIYTPPEPKATPVETVKVNVDVEDLDKLRELKRELQSVAWEYDRAADAIERFNDRRAGVDEDTRADMAFLTSTLAEGTDHQRTTYETLREAGVPIYEIATSFRSAFDTQADG